MSVRTVVTAVLSLDANCMVSWNKTVDYMYTQSRECVCGGGGGVSCWMVNGRELGGSVIVLVLGRMWPGTFKCSFCDSQFPLSTALLTVSTVCNEVKDH